MPTCSDNTTRSAAGATLDHRLYRGTGVINHAGHDCDAIQRLLAGQEPTVRIDWAQRKADRQAASPRQLRPYPAASIQIERQMPPEHRNGNCPCHPQAKTVAGRTVYHHNRDLCPYFPPQWPPASARPKQPQPVKELPRHPDRLDELPSLPPLREFHTLLEHGAQLVLAIYNPANGKKEPLYAGWTKAKPGFPEVLHHIKHQPNALIGLIPASLGAVVADVDQGNWRQLADQLGSKLTNPTMQRGRRHIWTPTEPGAAAPPNTGFAVDGITGDIRHRNAYVIIWNRQAARNARAIARMTAKGKYRQPFYPTRKMRQHHAKPTSGGRSSAAVHYAAIFAAQVAAANRHRRMVNNIVKARHLHQKGWTIGQLAHRFNLSKRRIHSWLWEKHDLRPILMPHQLRERAAARQQYARYVAFYIRNVPLQLWAWLLCLTAAGAPARPAARPPQANFRQNGFLADHNRPAARDSRGPPSKWAGAAALSGIERPQAA